MVTLIAYLEGTILLQRKDRVIVKAGHVGYEVYVPRVIAPACVAKNASSQ